MKARDRRWLFLIAISCGLLIPGLLIRLPDGPVIPVLAVLSIILLAVRQLRLLACFVLAVCWSMWHYGQVLQQRLLASLAGTTMTAVVTVVSAPVEYPDATRLDIRPVHGLERKGGPSLPAKVRAYWYRNTYDIRAGDRWELQLRLRPPWSNVNFQGGDTERWLFSQRIGAMATVVSGRRIQRGSRFEPCRLRQNVAEVLGRILLDHPMAGIVSALAIADRSGMTAQQRQLLMETGTSHLLAISGLHIGLAALGGFGVGQLLSGLLAWLWSGMNRACRRLYFAVGIALISAFVYALLAALQISTQRALLMVAAVSLALLARRRLPALQTLLLAFTGVLLLDPLAALSAGFWFSFGAVLALLLTFRYVSEPGGGSRGRLWMLIRAQCAVMLLMAPMGALWFQSLSLSGLIANLVAIPWVSMAVVPSVLIGLFVIPLSETAAALPLFIAAEAAGLLLDFLDAVRGLLPWTLGTRMPGAFTMSCACFGALMLLLPHALGLRWLGCLAFTPLFLPAARSLEHGAFEVEFLDVGQGTAVLVSSHGHKLLYDTGPGDGQGNDRVSSVIGPALRGRLPPSPDWVVLSHGDLDHAGGAATVKSLFPEADWLANSGSSERPDQCLLPTSWAWDGLTFTVLHPRPGLPYLGNDSSCVLSVRSDAGSVLLTGDISKAVEQRLALEGLLYHQLLLAPHHGSKSSSTAEFIRAAGPQIAVATTGIGNRFGFPRGEVLQRYRNAAVPFASTGQCGAIRVKFIEGEAPQVESARRVRNRIWRWPAAPDCP